MAAYTWHRIEAPGTEHCSPSPALPSPVPFLSLSLLIASLSLCFAFRPPPHAPPAALAGNGSASACCSGISRRCSHLCAASPPSPSLSFSFSLPLPLSSFFAKRGIVASRSACSTRLSLRRCLHLFDNNHPTPTAPRPSTLPGTRRSRGASSAAGRCTRRSRPSRPCRPA